jgi:hypothetical protein
MSAVDGRANGHASLCGGVSGLCDWLLGVCPLSFDGRSRILGERASLRNAGEVDHHAFLYSISLHNLSMSPRARSCSAFLILTGEGAYLIHHPDSQHLSSQPAKFNHSSHRAPLKSRRSLAAFHTPGSFQRKAHAASHSHGPLISVLLAIHDESLRGVCADVSTALKGSGLGLSLPSRDMAQLFSTFLNLQNKSRDLAERCSFYVLYPSYRAPSFP